MKFRDELGRPLTGAEEDENKRELLALIAELRSLIAGLNTIAGAAFVGANLQFGLLSGDILSIPVPWPVPSFAGDWQPLTFYAALTFVSVSGQGIYCTLQPLTSGPVFDETATDGDNNPLYRKLFPISSPRYVLAASWPGIFTAANQNIFSDGLTTAITFPANFGAYGRHISTAGGSVAPTGDFTIDIAKAPASDPTSFSSVGSIDFSAGSVIPTFTTAGGEALLFAQNDAIRIRGPATPDPAFLDFRCSLVGFETP